MVAQPLEIHIDPESETGKLLAQAGEQPLVLVAADGARYCLESTDPLAYYDSERAAVAWRATFGTLREIDLEAFKAEMRAWRGTIDIGGDGGTC